MIKENEFSFGDFENLKPEEVGYSIRRFPNTPGIQEVFWVVRGVRQETSKVVLDGNARCGNCLHLEGNRVKHCISFVSDEQGIFILGAQVHTLSSLTNQVCPLYPNNDESGVLHPNSLITVNPFEVANLIRIRRELKEAIGADD